MYKITLWNVGSNRVTKDISCFNKLLDTAVEGAVEYCKKILGHDKFEVVDLGNGGYVLRKLDSLLGSFTITKLD